MSVAYASKKPRGTLITLLWSPRKRVHHWDVKIHIRGRVVCMCGWIVCHPWRGNLGTSAWRCYVARRLELHRFVPTKRGSYHDNSTVNNNDIVAVTTTNLNTAVTMTIVYINKYLCIYIYTYMAIFCSICKSMDALLYKTMTKTCVNRNLVVTVSALWSCDEEPVEAGAQICVLPVQRCQAEGQEAEKEEEVSASFGLCPPVLAKKTTAETCSPAFLEKTNFVSQPWGCQCSSLNGRSL